MTILFAQNKKDSSYISECIHESRECTVLESEKEFHDALLIKQPDAVIVSADSFKAFPELWADFLLIDRFMTEIVIFGEAQELIAIKSRLGDTVSFIAKPVDPKELDGIIARKIESRKIVGSVYPPLAPSEKSYSHLRDRLFNNLLEGHSIPDDTGALLDFLKLSSEKAKFFLVFVVSFTAVSGFRTEDVWETAIRVKDITRQEISKLGINRSCIREQNQITFMLMIEEPGDEFKFVFSDTMETVQKRVRSECRQEISVGVGLASNLVSDITWGYNEACDALEQGCFLGKSFLCFYSDLWLRGERRLQFSKKAKEQLLSLLYRNDFKKIDDIIEQEFDTIGSQGIASKENILSLEIDLTVFLMDISNRLSVVEEHPQIYSAVLSDFLTCDCLSSMEIVMKKTLRDISAASIKTQETRSGHIVKDVQKIITERINEPLNVQLLAQYIHISPNYLSAVFKEETGMRLIEYVNSIKLKKAASMLLKTDCSIAKITEEVGYDNSNYFSQLFKKQYGVKPSEYRRMNIG